jgi:transcriptional regulator with XRE-family HTH domain
MSLYDRVRARSGGDRALAVARLKRTVLSALHEGLGMSGIASQSDLARRLGVRRSAVNQVLNGDGNVRISTLAEYLHEMGYELDLNLVRSGEPRAAALEARVIYPSAQGARSSASVLIFIIGEFDTAATKTRTVVTGAWLQERSPVPVESASSSSQVHLSTAKSAS